MPLEGRGFAPALARSSQRVVSSGSLEERQRKEGPWRRLTIYRRGPAGKPAFSRYIVPLQDLSQTGDIPQKLSVIGSICCLPGGG